MVPDSLLTCVLDIEKQRKPERPPLFSIIGTGVRRRITSYSGFTLFAEHMLPDIVVETLKAGIPQISTIGQIQIVQQVVQI